MTDTTTDAPTTRRTWSRWSRRRLRATGPSARVRLGQRVAPTSRSRPTRRRSSTARSRPGRPPALDAAMSELLDLQDDLADVVVWLAENWSADLPVPHGHQHATGYRGSARRRIRPGVRAAGVLRTDPSDAGPRWPTLLGGRR